MAITEPVDRIDEFVDNYNKITSAMLGADSFQKKMIENINDIFDSAGISTEQKGVALTELSSQTSVQYNKDAVSSALEVIKLAPDFELKAIQRDLVARQIKGFDDNLKVKIMETQGSLASFAVNANSDNAQNTINDLKEKMSEIDSRVAPINPGDNCPVPTPITPVPSDFLALSITDTSIELSFNVVQNATLYLIYRDGVLISQSSQIGFTDSALTPSTKYAYNIKASVNGILSDFSSTLIVSTTATV